MSQETLDHIRQVQKYLHQVAANLMERARVHDASKLCEPEASVFAEFTPKLKGCTYGSDEYKQFLAAMKPALDHHYAANSHHPEYYANGIAGMSLLDVVEMLCDWRAATERHTDGSMSRSLAINKERFKIDDQLYSILVNTCRQLGWVDDSR